MNVLGREISGRRMAAGAGVAAASFAVLGTVAALWDNPLFVRMTPAGVWEIAMLAAMSGLFGVYVAIRRPACSMTGAGAGGVLAFLGVTCPVCNKILLLIFGGELLLTWFEPVRIYVAAAGALLVGWMAVREWMITRPRGAAAAAE